MHPATEDLLSLRDDEPVDADVRAHVDTCSRCRDRLADFRRLSEALRLSPLPTVEEPMPWRTRRPKPNGGAAWRAAAGIVVIIGLLAGLAAIGIPRDHVDATVPLVRESQHLERDLAAIRGDGGVVRLSTLETVTELEMAIARIDMLLNAGSGAGQGAEKTDLWRRRVDLMESLVAVEYAGRARHGDPASGNDSEERTWL